MTELTIYNQEGKAVGKVPLKGNLWESEVNSHVLHLALKQELANRRAGTHSTKTRDEVSGTGKKPWKQKGTGRARSGSVRSPLWRHGGVVFGPHPRSHGFTLTRQVRTVAFRCAFRNLLNDGRLAVLEKIQLAQSKTKLLAKLFSDLNKVLETAKAGTVPNQSQEENALVLYLKPDEKLTRANRNLPHIKFLPVSQLNVHDLLRFKKVFLMKDALTALEEAFV